MERNPAQSVPQPTGVEGLLQANSPDPITILTLLDALYHQRYSGALTVHLRNGQPQVVEFVQSTRLKLTPAGVREAPLPPPPAAPVA